MSAQVIPITIKGVLPTRSGCALFLGNDDKVFIIYIDHAIGGAISNALRQAPSERPQTHELISHLLMGLGAKLERVIINDSNGGVFYARMILSMENELFHQKILELDARPSDAVAVATLVQAPLYVTLNVWNEVKDMSEALSQLPPPNAGETGESEDDIPF